MNRGPLLAIPSCKPGQGSGHLVRCMALVRELRSMNREAWLFLPSDNEQTDKIVNVAGYDPSWIVREREWPDFAERISNAGKAWECIILDHFQTPPETFSRWATAAPLVGIDEGGPCRNSFDFLIDILPGGGATATAHHNIHHKWKPANISDPSLLPLPEKAERSASRPASAPLKVLVSFGQEDSAKLGPATAKELAARNSGGCLDITLPEKAIPRLSERLGEYDLVITHYGLTAFESLYAGVPVLLLSPGAYHEKLARAAGFCSAGIGPKKAGALARLLLKKNTLNHSFLHELESLCAGLAARHKLDRKPPLTLASLIDGFTPIVGRSCPVCGAVLHGEAIARYAERSYRRCPDCGIINMNRVNQPPIEYARDYFFESYKKQYGKTYIEDFPNLINMAGKRLAIIRQLLKTAGGEPAIGGKPATADTAAAVKPRLLDIGCAYGPFLAAAQERGFSPCGIDPAEDAVQYVRTLGIPAVQGSFPNCRLPECAPEAHGGLYDVITLWYVIEHLRDCAPALAEIRRLLRPGGVLAFATPSFSGISGRASLARFLEASPADHWTVWSPASCRKALAQAGFTVKKIVVSGHHPERFPLVGKHAHNAKSPLYRILLALSKLCALGDTFEVYCV